MAAKDSTEVDGKPLKVRELVAPLIVDYQFTCAASAHTIAAHIVPFSYRPVELILME